jgi:hypothetical protein
MAVRLIGEEIPAFLDIQCTIDSLSKQGVDVRKFLLLGLGLVKHVENALP